MKKLLLLVSISLGAGLSYGQQWGDYTLYSQQNSTSTYLLDTNGTVVHTWTHTNANKTGYSSYLMPGGVLVRAVAIAGNSFSGGTICGKVQKIDFDGNLL